jgi:hypothetical protein
MSGIDASPDPFRVRGTLRTLCAASLVVCVLAPAAADARQTSSAQLDSTQIAALVRYPGFFHSRTVIVQGAVTIVEGRAWIEHPAGGRVLLLRLTGVNNGQPIQVRGTFVDAGRLPRNDARFAQFGLDKVLSGALPRPGELLAINVDRAAPYSPASGPATLYAVVLDPERFLNQAVVVVGQFRGRNLVGDQPAAPGRDKWEFVLRNGTSSLWVAGRKPQGFDFNLDPAAPKDVGRWLRVNGVVRREKDLVYIEADAIERGDSEPEVGLIERTQPMPALPPPEITFSLPVEDEADVSLKAVVRVQFSRVMKGESFVGKVRASYIGGGTPGAGPVPDPDLSAIYMPKDQVLVISFVKPLERFRRVKIELLDGIGTPDGSPLRPWTLTFSTGSR